jgi:hypothetical protein
MNVGPIFFPEIGFTISGKKGFNRSFVGELQDWEGKIAS